MHVEVGQCYPQPGHPNNYQFCFSRLGFSPHQLWNRFTLVSHLYNFDSYLASFSEFEKYYYTTSIRPLGWL